MKYIDKINEASANPIIDAYLSFARRQPWYSGNKLYSEFRGSRGKHQLIDKVLLPEQENLCCYCQKRLGNHTDADVTIEHIIRQHTPKALMPSYFKPAYLGLNAHNVCYTDDFVNNRQRPKPYPHKVAYHNFAIACKKCNEARGHQDLDIPFLYPLIESEVTYDRSTGKIKWNNDPFVPVTFRDRLTVDKLNLNDKLLKAIRAVWIFGKDNPVSSYSTPDTVSNLGQRRDLIYRTMAASATHNKWFSLEDQDAFISLLTDGLWNELLKYDYFSTI